MTLSTSRLRRAARGLFCLVITACSDGGATAPTQSAIVVQLDRDHLVLEAGGSARLNIVSASGVLPAGLKVSWSSSNPAVAEVDQGGQVTARSAGEAVVTGNVSQNLSRMTLAANVQVTGAATALKLLAGGEQSGRVGAVLPQPVQVQVADASGRPVKNVTVTFTARSGELLYNTSTATTDDQGVASANWTLGTQAGAHTLTATAGKATVVAQALAQPGEPTAFVLQSGAGQTGIVGSPLGTLLRVRAQDAFGNAVPGTALRWEVEGESGAFENPPATTDAEGFASARWLLGPRVGEQAGRVVSIAGAIRFTANAIAPYASRVQVTGNASVLDARGATVQLSATAFDHTDAPISGLPLMWWSQHPQIATVNQDGIVTALSNGTTQIYASADGQAGAYTVSVRQEVVQVIVEPANVSLTGPGTITQLTEQAVDGMGNPVSPAGVTWSSDAPGVVTVDSDGRVRAVGTGTAEILAVVNGKVGRSKVFVGSPGPASVTQVTVTPAADSLLAIGQSRQLTATATAGGRVDTTAVVTWRSLAPEVAGVSPSGNVTAVANGTAAIVATAGAKADTARITVRQKVTRVTVAPSALALSRGSSRRLDFHAYDANGFSVAGTQPTWSSTVAAVARVDASGMVLAAGAGSAHIVASFGTLTARSTITVTAAGGPSPAAVAVTPASAQRTAGDSIQATAVVRDSSNSVIEGAAVTWSSSNVAVAQVNPTGLIRVLGVGTAVITAAAGQAQGTLQLTALGASPVARVVATPQRDTITAIGHSRAFTAAALDAQGNPVPGAAIMWTSLHPSIAAVSEAGNVTAKTIGTALIVAAAAGCPGCVADTVTTVVIQRPASVAVNADSLDLEVGATRQLQAVVKDAAGVPINNKQVTWSAEPAGIVSVSSTGLVAALSSGSATIIAIIEGVSSRTDVDVTLGAPPTPPPPVASDGEFVVFPNEAVAFILGPQLKSGSSANPWPFFDENAIETGRKHGPVYEDNPGDRNYYDQVRVQYLNYYRTGDTTFLGYARRIADHWYARLVPMGTNIAPRSASISGLMLRALDGRPELWPWIEAWTDAHLWNWVERRIDNETLHYGLRDGGYAFYYGALMAGAHPDAATRAKYKERVSKVALEYFARLQFPNGGWYWTDSQAGVRIQKPDGSYYKHSQAFMVGLMLEGLIAAHELSGDERLKQAIVHGTEWLYQYGYRPNEPTPVAGLNWRGGWYFVFEPGTPLPNPPADASDPRYAPDGITVVQGTVALRGGWDTNSIREARQHNCTQVHVFGYAFKVTGEARFRDMGDELFAASFGKGRGPLTDQLYALGDYQAKQYNQCYRSAGSYLARRLGR